VIFTLTDDLQQKLRRSFARIKKQDTAQPAQSVG
jgi:hypothetical protein